MRLRLQFDEGSCEELADDLSRQVRRQIAPTKCKRANMFEQSLYAAATRVTVGRRTMLKLAATGSAGLAFLPRALAQNAKAPPKPENVLSPDAALERLMNGNVRYVQGVSKRHDFSHEREPLRTGQNPFAAGPQLCRFSYCTRILFRHGTG